jgi:leucyl-tRNA synthetase
MLSKKKKKYTAYLILLSPFAPHIAEELYSKMGYSESIFLQKWPQYNPEFLKEEEIEMAVQVNGKLRDRIFVAPDVTEDEAKEMALESAKVQAFTQGKEIKKIIFVPERLINIVIG